MFNVMKNTFRILLRRKSLLITLIVIPTILTLLFSAILGGSVSYSVGVVNDDHGVVSDEIIKTLGKVGSIKLRSLDEDKVDSSIVGKEVEVCVVFPKDFSKNIMASKKDDVILKSVGDSEIKHTVSSIINDKSNDLLNLSKLSGNDDAKFKLLVKDLDSSDVKYRLNDVKGTKVHVINSIGIIIMMIFTSSAFITRFVIDDEVQGTKDRVLLGKVSKGAYYFGMVLVFYLCSCITSLLYYVICNLMNFDFGTGRSIDFLFVLFAVNFLAIAFNLATITVSKTPSVASNVSSIFTTVCCMLGGLFWPFELMPSSVKMIGQFIPLRWPMVAFERIYKGSSFMDVGWYVFGVVFVGFLFLGITVLGSRKKSR